jgi:hypothetical protein
MQAFALILGAVVSGCGLASLLLTALSVNGEFIYPNASNVDIGTVLIAGTVATFAGAFLRWIVEHPTATGGLNHVWILLAALICAANMSFALRDILHMGNRQVPPKAEQPVTKEPRLVRGFFVACCTASVKRNRRIKTAAQPPTSSTIAPRLPRLPHSKLFNARGAKWLICRTYVRGICRLEWPRTHPR